FYSGPQKLPRHTLLFLRSYRDHRDLHSFPTRRSSDLPILGQNYGARRYDRLVVALRDALVFVTAYCLAMWALLALLASPIASLRSEEHTSELQSRENLVCRLLLEKKKTLA